MFRSINRRLITILFFVFALLVLGTVGYMLIEGWDFDDALYMTTITLTTVGYSEVHPLSVAGQFFTIFLIILGVSVIAYSLSILGEYIFSNSLGGELKKRQTKRMIKKMQNHIIICGYGRVGRSAAPTLHENSRDVVIIDSDLELVARAREDGFATIHGDAASDDVLREAGLEKAWGVVVSTGEDSLNLFIVLSARTLNPDLYIVARAVNAENERKMVRAGADRVVSPYRIGGKHMANIMLRPHVTDFFDVVTLQGGQELWIEELVIADDSALIGQTVGQANVRRQTGVSMVALTSKVTGQTIVPDANTLLTAGDELIVLGTRDQLAALRELTRSPLSQTR
ncbi:MAG: potassium channel protein [Anaerolineales bacterium]|nr:potassium channel protein [Anaerolineales bacterium]